LPSEKDSVGGAFWSGVLAAALATPCSAPFVGTALSFALTRGSGEIIAIFAAMGVGLAAPYLATAAAPALAQLLPKPGNWMNGLRKVLSVLVALTGVWLVWVLSRQAGMAAAAIALVAAVLVIAALVIIGPVKRWRFVGAGVVIGLAAVWFTAAPPASSATDAFAWAQFDEGDIQRRVANGEVVLVDVTADWCVTCKWNKAVVLNRDPIAALLAGDVMPMQADWTRPDPEITAYLAKHGRFGIPFNIVYGPGAPAGVQLPELLSADDVLEAIKKARG
jgi:suppressor for copper-sensitivity B